MVPSINCTLYRFVVAIDLSLLAASSSSSLRSSMICVRSAEVGTLKLLFFAALTLLILHSSVASLKSLFLLLCLPRMSNYVADSFYCTPTKCWPVSVSFLYVLPVTEACCLPQLQLPTSCLVESINCCCCSWLLSPLTAAFLYFLTFCHLISLFLSVSLHEIWFISSFSIACSCWPSWWPFCSLQSWVFDCFLKNGDGNVKKTVAIRLLHFKEKCSHHQSDSFVSLT